MSITEPLLLPYLFCCQFANSEEIKDLLEDLATGKQGCKLTPKLSTYGDDYKRLYIDVLKHFDISGEDQHTKSGVTIKSWSSIRKKSVKDLLLKNYIIRIQQQYFFDNNTVNNFKRELMIHLNIKKIGDKHIIIENNNIVVIKGIILSKNSYTLTFGEV
jgi:hypothetical protein